MSEETIVHRQMGCTIDELLYWLPAATNHQHFSHQTKDQSLIVQFLKVDLTLEAVAGESRKIALLVIPVLNATFRFGSKWGKLEIDAFMKRFDLYTQRGGG